MTNSKGFTVIIVSSSEWTYDTSLQVTRFLCEADNASCVTGFLCGGKGLHIIDGMKSKYGDVVRTGAIHCNLSASDTVIGSASTVVRRHAYSTADGCTTPIHGQRGRAPKRPRPTLSGQI